MVCDEVYFGNLLQRAYFLMLHLGIDLGAMSPFQMGRNPKNNYVCSPPDLFWW
jgi:hypothetical protein